MIYFIEAKEVCRIKIGFTDDKFDRRFDDLRTSSPVPLDILATSPGPRALEKELHRAFGSWRRNGEWFEGCDELRALIRRISDASEPAREGILWDECAKMIAASQDGWSIAESVSIVKECQRAWIEAHGIAETARVTGKTRDSVRNWRDGKNLICMTSATRMIRADKVPFAPLLAPVMLEWARQMRADKVDVEAAGEIHFPFRRADAAHNESCAA